MYKCSFCGKEFDSAVDRARCEIKCDDITKKESERLKMLKYNEEKNKAEERINNAIQALDKDIEEYVKKYGISPKSLNDNNLFSILMSLCF